MSTRRRFRRPRSQRATGRACAAPRAAVEAPTYASAGLVRPAHHWKHSPSPQAAAWSIWTNTRESRLARPPKRRAGYAHGKAPAGGRDFLMRLVAQHGLRGAARVRWRMSWTDWPVNRGVGPFTFRAQTASRL